MRISGWLFLLQQTGISSVLLMMTCRLMHVRPRYRQLLAASLVCGAFSLAWCVTESILSFIAVSCCFLTVPRLCGIRLPGCNYLRGAILMLCLSLLCAGMMRALSAFILPPLLPFGAALLLVIPAIDQRLPAASCATVTIAVAGQHIRLTALVDSGNLLRDPLTALPVIVCSRRALTPLDPMRRHLRLLSVRTAAGSALMPVFRADSIRLLCGGKWQSVSALIGVAPEEYDGFQALVPSSLTSSVSTPLPS